jgi:hypothetical protein
MFPGVTRDKNSTYSSEWNCVISRFVAGFARFCAGISIRERKPIVGTYEYLHLLVEPVVHDQ